MKYALPAQGIGAPPPMALEFATTGRGMDFAYDPNKAANVPAVNLADIRTAKPAPTAGAGAGFSAGPGLSLVEGSTGGYGKAQQAYSAMLDDAIERERRKVGGRIAPTPEREQRLGFSTDASRGPDPKLMEEQNDLRLGREPRIPEEPPPAVVTGDDVLALFQAPPGEDPKKWAAAQAARIREEGGSVAGEVAKGLDGGGLVLRELAADPLPAKLRGKTGEEIDAWEAESRARKTKVRDEYINALDGAHNEARDLHAKALSGDQKAQAEYVRRYGEGGLVGAERRKIGIAEDLAEEKAKTEERYGETERAFAAKNAEIERESRRRIDKITADMDTLREQASRGVDPGKFWREKDMGQQIGMALAVFASAIGSGLTGQANGALAQIDRAMERDLEEQRRQIHEGTNQRLTVLQTLYKNVLQETGDEKAAALAMRNSALEEYKRKMTAFAERAGKKELREASLAALAVAKDKQIAAEMEMSERVRGKVATNWRVIPATAGGYGGGPDLGKIRGLMKEKLGLYEKGVEVGGKGVDADAKSFEAAAKAANPNGKAPELVNLGGKWYQLEAVTSTAEGEKARAALKGLSDVDYFTEEIKKEQGKYGTRAFQPEVFTSLLREHAKALSRAQNEGVTRQEDVTAAEKMFGGWTGGSGKVAEQFLRYNKHARESLLRGYGAREVQGPRR